MDSTITLNDSENQVFKKTGSNGWNAQVRSSIGYNSGCSLSFTANINNRAGMIGINTDPTTNNNYNTIDFAWYMTGSSFAYIYENGASKGSFGSFSAGSIFVITYDNNTVRYYLNGTLKRSVTVGAGKTYYLDSSFQWILVHTQELFLFILWVQSAQKVIKVIKVTQENEDFKDYTFGTSWYSGFCSTKWTTCFCDISS